MIYCRKDMDKLEDVLAPDILNNKMPKRKQEHEHVNYNHVEVSKDVPQPKKLRKKTAEKSSDDQQKEKKQEPLDGPFADTHCQQSRFVSAKHLTYLSYDLLVEIAKRLKKLEDFTCFRSVSKSLHLSVKGEYFEGLRFRQSIPYLMLPPVSRDDGTNGDVRELYSLVGGESTVASLEPPMFKSSKMCMCFESLGWLLTVEKDGSLRLFDPFSDIEIPVPHMNTFPRHNRCLWDMHFEIKKMVLSSRPNKTSSGFILMIIIGGPAQLGFWRLGDKAWNSIDILKWPVRDVVYDGREQFYASTVMGSLWVVNLAAGKDNHHVEYRIIIDCNPILRILDPSENQYIVKTIDGSLLCIRRRKEFVYYLTSEFYAYEIDIETGTWKEIYSLGSMAVFLGRNSSIAVDASSNISPMGNGGGVIKANHIYFTDDFFEFQHAYFKGWVDWRAYSRGSQEAKGGSVDCGVYNFETRAVEPIYPVEPLLSNVCPAMWITPNLSF